MGMKPYFLFIIFFYFFSCDTFASEADAALAAVKALNYVTTHEADIWPGFKVNTIPVFIYFEDNKHVYAYNFTPKNKQIKNVIIDNTPVYFFDNDPFDFDANPDDFQTINGKLIYIFRFVNYDNENDILFSVRNMINKRFSFFLINESAFPRKIFAFWNIDYSGFNQIDNVEYAYLEAEELKNYLLKNSIESLKNYLAIHHKRRSLISKNAAEYEDTSDIRFGIGAYAGYKALNLSESAYLKQVVSTYVNNLSCPSYENVQQMQYCISLAHYYLAGPAAGYALDKAQGNAWKASIVNLATTPQTLLDKMYPMNDNEIAQRVEKSKKTYHFESIEQKVENKLRYYINEMQKQQNAYKKLPGVEINIDYRYCKPTKYSSKFREEFDISNRKTLMTYYNMLLECNVQGSLVSIEFKQLPFLFEMDSILNTQFKVSSDTKVIIDGNQQTIQHITSPNTKIHFHKLKIENNQVILQVNGNGSINESHGVLRISS